MAGLVCTEYKVRTKADSDNLRIAVLADLHSRRGTDVEDIAQAVAGLHPDVILMPGDTFERLDGSRHEDMAAGLELIRKVSAVAPVYLSIGNHENGGVRSWNAIKWSRIGSLPKVFDESELDLIRKSGALILDDSFTLHGSIAIGGLTSGLINEQRRPHLESLDEFFGYGGTKILMCHHPEYYAKYLADKQVDLVVSGHAHGGQWRIFGRGVFAPGQGIFPKYTSGVHDGRHVISRGLKRARIIPRFFNPPEIVVIELIPE